MDLCSGTVVEAASGDVLEHKHQRYACFISHVATPLLMKPFTCVGMLSPSHELVKRRRLILGSMLRSKAAELGRGDQGGRGGDRGASVHRCGGVRVREQAGDPEPQVRVRAPGVFE